MESTATLLTELDGNLKGASDLADEVVSRIHTPLLGLLIGDVSPKVVWKMLYVNHTCPDLEERCTMLGVLTDYISHTPSLLEAPRDRKDTHSPTHLVKVLGDSWCVVLPKAKKGLAADAFLNFARTLGRCFTTLVSYNLHDGLAPAVKLSADLRAPQSEDTDPQSTSIIDFPRMALVSATKLKQIRPVPKTNRRRRVKFVRMDDAPLRQITNLPERQTIIPPRPHQIQTATIQTTNTSGHQLLGMPNSPTINTTGHQLNPCGHVIQETESHKIAVSTEHQLMGTPTRQISNGHNGTPTREVIYTPGRQSTNTPGRQLLTPTSKNSTPETISLHGSTSRSTVTPTQRRLIHAELARLHLLRRSPAMPLHSTSLNKNDSPSHGSVSSISQLQASVHRTSTNSSFHPIEKRVMKELYF